MDSALNCGPGGRVFESRRSSPKDHPCPRSPSRAAAAGATTDLTQARAGARARSAAPVVASVLARALKVARVGGRAYSARVPTGRDREPPGPRGQGRLGYL